MSGFISLAEVAQELNLEMPASLVDLGELPELKWIPIKDLVIDTQYQRKILRTGRRNISGIVSKFDWTKFGAIQVAEVSGRYAIIDGQHRTVAALIRGLEAVPCNVVVANSEQQALAFVSINSNVTQVSALTTFKAEVAAGVESSVRLMEACSKAGVTVSPYPVDANSIKPGVTIALGCIRRALNVYGEPLFVFALRSIVETAEDKNRGLLREAVIKAYCHLYDIEPDLMKEENILLLKRFDLRQAFDEASSGAKSRKSVFYELSVKLMEYFEKVGAL